MGLEPGFSITMTVVPEEADNRTVFTTEEIGNVGPALFGCAMANAILSTSPYDARSAVAFMVRSIQNAGAASILEEAEEPHAEWKAVVDAANAYVQKCKQS